MFDRSISSHNIRAAGSASAVGAVNKGVLWDSGTDEIVFDGHGGLVLANSADWVPAADFMVEIPGVKFTSNTTHQALMDHWLGTGNNRCWTLIYKGDLATKALRLNLSKLGGGDAVITDVAFTPTVGTAYDIAFNRIGDKWRIFAGESGGLLPMIGSVTLSGALYSGSAVLTIGAAQTLDATLAFTGRMKNVPRITNGSGRGGDDSGYTFPATIWPTS